MSLVFNGNSTIDNIVFNGKTVEHLIYNGVEVWSKQTIDYTTIPMTFKFLTSGVLSTKISNKNLAPTGNICTFKYIKNDDGVERSMYANKNSTNEITVSAGDTIKWTDIPKNYFVGNNGNYYVAFTSTAEFEIYGNLYLSTITSANDSRRYMQLFNGCTTLKSLEHFYTGTTTLSQYRYAYMFYGCSGITVVNDDLLPATTLATHCYEYMFYGCSSLTRAPYLPALTLVSSCYYQMFYNCTNLNYVKAMFTTTPSTSYTNNWLYGASSTGTFVKNSAATWGQIGYSAVPSGWTIQYATP